LVFHPVSVEQKAIGVKVCQENLKILYDGGHHIISNLLLPKRLMYDAPTNQESKIWLLETRANIG